MAGTTGLEPATSAVTGQRSNQLSYVPKMFFNTVEVRHVKSGVSQLRVFASSYRFAIVDSISRLFGHQIDTTLDPKTVTSTTRVSLSDEYLSVVRSPSTGQKNLNPRCPSRALVPGLTSHSDHEAAQSGTIACSNCSRFRSSRCCQMAAYEMWGGEKAPTRVQSVGDRCHHPKPANAVVFGISIADGLPGKFHSGSCGHRIGQILHSDGIATVQSNHSPFAIEHSCRSFPATHRTSLVCPRRNRNEWRG
jgi:hypothetical protein